MKKAIMFPGQGSQFVGMCKDIYENFPIARETFQEVDEALEQQLSNVILEGPESLLTQTKNAQPAIMASSVALTRILLSELKIDIKKLGDFALGHSLGEYSALCISDAISLGNTARLLKVRGEEMQKAVPLGEGTMIAVLGCDLDEANNLIKNLRNKGVCEVANYNLSTQIVLSGHIDAIEEARELAENKGYKVVSLKVSGPFHSSLMKPAREKLKEALEQVNINTPKIPVIANYSAKPVQNASEIKDLLINQVTGMVRFYESINLLVEKEVPTFIEIGPGKVLAGMVKRINRRANTHNITTIEDIENYCNNFANQ